MTAETARLLEEGEAIVMRLSTFVDLKRRIESLLCESAAAVILNEAGRECGKRACGQLATELGLRGYDLLSAFAKRSEEERWGEFDFSHVDLERGRGSVIVKGSFEARRYGVATKPVCYFIRGYISGALAVPLQRDVVLEEVRCIAKGDECCEFQIRSLL